jgi:dsDNA-specific endonuclease/ATPase MutS2
MAKRLANSKTKNQSGLDYVMGSLNLLTPFGEKAKKEMEPFFPGQEEDLRQELERIHLLKETIVSRKEYWNPVEGAFMEMKDCTFSITRAGKDVLTVVELFELKNLLLAMEKLHQHLEEFSEIFHQPLPEPFRLASVKSLLKALDPREEGIQTFYLYDEFSLALKELREKKRQLEKEIRLERKALSQQLKEEKGVSLTPKFECVVSKSEPERLREMEQVSRLCRFEEDYMSVTFGLKDTEKVDGLIHQMNQAEEAIEEEEWKVREALSHKVAEYGSLLLENGKRVGLFDRTYAKAQLALSRNLVKPEIIDDHGLELDRGRHLEVEALLERKGKEYCPVSFVLKPGVACITGANMGGKTVSLKLAGLVALMTQYGFFVPAAQAKVGLSSHIQMLIGDSQSLERGLSSFGGEMEELREALDHSQEKTLLLIDEIASGTNPKEGTALSKGLVSYLMKKPYICLITTHFDSVADLPGVVNLQVIGLAQADFERLRRELRYANRKERIQLVAKYMDYRLRVVEGARDVPKEAIQIAEILGLYPEIIEGAKGYL